MQDDLQDSSKLFAVVFNRHTLKLVSNSTRTHISLEKIDTTLRIVLK